MTHPTIQIDRACVRCKYNLRGVRIGSNCPECGLSSKVLHKEELRYYGKGDTGASARNCATCGHNLSGVDPQGSCPECGTSISATKYRDDPLSSMPLDVIRAFRLGGWIAAVCMMMSIGWIAATMIRSFPPLVESLPWIVIAAIWVWSAFLLTPTMAVREAVSRGFGARSQWRTIARWSQLAWIGSTSIAVIDAAITSPTSASALVLQVLGIASMVVGVIGLVMLLVLMERLAEWVRDDVAQRSFNWAIWVLPVSLGLGVVQQSFGISGLFGLLTGGIVLLQLSAIAAIPWGFLSLARSLTYAVLHAHEARDLEDQRRRRRAEYTDEVADSVSRMDVRKHA